MNVNDFNPFKPMYTQAEVLKALEWMSVSNDTLNNWIKNGNVELTCSTRGGRGVRRMYCASDVLTIAAMAELAMFGVQPGNVQDDSDLESIAVVAASCAGTMLAQDMGVWGDPKKLNPAVREQGRYLNVYYNAYDKTLDWSISSDPYIVPRIGSMCLVIDGQRLSDMVIDRLNSTTKDEE